MEMREVAAELWARSRQAGMVTADPKALDVDVIPGAQALLYDAGDDQVLVITTNPKDLSRFVTGKHWIEGKELSKWSLIHRGGGAGGGE